MKVRATVFDSKAEERVFRSLQSRWSSELVLYPSLPLAKLICLEEDDRLPANEQRFFYIKPTSTIPSVRQAADHSLASSLTDSAAALARSACTFRTGRLGTVTGSGSLIPSYGLPLLSVILWWSYRLRKCGPSTTSRSPSSTESLVSSWLSTSLMIT